ncbi:potassium/sodium hyperpolarization-activated cyclic nucleotide-gated channel 1-like isoform X1 [Alosa sapidissima]|uniref:potassium/sodium hyperpolarization-activated cyclic nucleotide-gated channel 1-like isoform X1 n=1 Tax=Alosa sapidissima TaxID=34773 RepID=UPI001C082155|nr:potassium/sodium hyperpolarization-activated cyclic nucleotide-gated channel 1-like isoform X1 [Alosa sapidissima]
MTNVDSACFFSTRKIGVMDNSTKKEPRNRLSKLLLPETSKFTLYYYRSKDEILKEQKKTEDLNYFIIHPYSLFRRYWLWIMILMSSTNIVFVPMVASFFGKQIYIGWTVYNVFVDISFIVDLCLTFRMGYHHGSMEAILDLRKIRNHYLKTWFIPDLLAATPVDYCVLILSTTLGGVDPDESRHLLKITNVFSLLRLLRVFRLVRYVNNCLERLSVSMKSFLEVIYNIFGIYLICHWNACFQFMLATWLDYPPNSWVTLAGLVDKPISVQYTRAMFRSLCHMMTLNYGSGIPKGISEQWMMITSITVGSVLYALVLAKITSLQATFNTSQRAYEDRHNELKVYIRHKQVGGTLVTRVFGHMENCYQGKWFDEKAILDELSEPLKLAVMQHVCGDLLRNAFGNADLLFLSKLLLVVEFESYQMGDVIIRPGITADYMYFIDKGTIMVEDAGVQHKLIDGDFFGEIALVKFSKHYIKVWNLSPSRLVCLSCQAYHTVLQDFPELQGKQLSRRSLAPQRGGRT